MGVAAPENFWPVGFDVSGRLKRMRRRTEWYPSSEGERSAGLEGWQEVVASDSTDEAGERDPPDPVEEAKALGSLPERSQQALALFNISGLSYEAVSELLGVPVSTVKKRLHDGRTLMKERIMEMTEDGFEQLRLSRSEEFSRKTLDTIQTAVESIAVGDVPGSSRT